MEKAPPVRPMLFAFPRQGEVVMVRHIADRRVSVLDYTNTQGNLLLSPRSHPNDCIAIRSLGDHMFPARVVRVDSRRGLMDLTSSVSTEEDRACRHRYRMKLIVDRIFEEATRSLGVHHGDVYERIVWRLVQKCNHPYEGFLRILTEGNASIFDGIPGITKEIKDVILSKIKKHIPQLECKVYLKIQCFAIDGILHIQDAIRKAMGSTDVKVLYIAAPYYEMRTFTYDEDEGISVLHRAIEILKVAIEFHGGKIVVKGSPAVVKDKSGDKAFIDKLLKDEAAATCALFSPREEALFSPREEEEEDEDEHEDEEEEEEEEEEEDIIRS